MDRDFLTMPHLTSSIGPHFRDATQALLAYQLWQTVKALGSVDCVLLGRGSSASHYTTLEYLGYR